MLSTDLLTSPVKWYNSLVPKNSENQSRTGVDLLSRVSEKDLETGLLICGVTDRDNHVFALFPSYVSFAKFFMTIPIERRTFFEIINGESNQKPHFDLEIENEMTPEQLDRLGDDFLRNFLHVLIPLFEQTYNVKLNLATDVLIFTSHGRVKRSFHVIIDNYSHSNHLEAKALYNLVVDKVKPEFKSYIDMAVYSKRQQFRIAGCQKKGTGRIKKLMTTWNYEGKEINYKYKEDVRNDGHGIVLLLEASLVSYTRNCRLLHNVLPEIPPEKRWQKDRDDGDLHPDSAQVALSLIAKKAGVDLSDSRFPYEIRAISGNLVLLKRLRPSYCFQCTDPIIGGPRLHEHENPFIAIVHDEETQMRRVYFDCRRGSRVYLGVLPEIHNNQYLPDSPIRADVVSVIDKVSRIAEIQKKKIDQVRKKATKLNK